jgi:predicted RNase H-like HicB family nuclease
LAQRFYPGVLERGPKETYAIWFPDFPDCVIAARTQEDAMALAQEQLARSVYVLAEKEQALPQPTPFERIVIPKSCDLVTLFVLGVDPPDPSERVNVYLPKSLLQRADRRAAELGMSRSSFFGLAVSHTLGAFVPLQGTKGGVWLRQGPRGAAGKRPSGRRKPSQP